MYPAYQIKRTPSVNYAYRIGSRAIRNRRSIAPVRFRSVGAHRNASFHILPYQRDILQNWDLYRRGCVNYAADTGGVGMRNYARNRMIGASMTSRLDVYLYRCRKTA